VLGDGEVAVNRNGRGPVRRRAAAHSLNSLLENERAVDFVKMDIEGAERDVLRTSTEWSSKVRSMKIEVHEPYTVDQCAQDLRRLGFRTRPDGRHWASVVAFR
jgi:hypothetical protein